MPDDTEAAGDPSSVIREMQDLARAYMDVEDDEEDRLEMEKVTTSLQKLLAKQQKDMEAATGTTQGARFLRRNGPY